MESKQQVSTDTAPRAIGAYSQAIRHDPFTFISGQIPLDPETMELVASDFSSQTMQVLDNLEQVCIAAGGDLDSLMKITVYVTDLANFEQLNQAMQSRFNEPYPARAVVQVSRLPRDASIEIDGLMITG